MDLWRTLVDEITEPLPETVIEYQAEDQFKEQEDDSVKVKYQKKLKRLARRVSMPFKKDKSGWKQVIQLRQSAKLQLLGISDLPDRLMADEFEYLSSALGKLLEQEPVQEAPTEEEINETDQLEDQSESSDENSESALNTSE